MDSLTPPPAVEKLEKAIDKLVEPLVNKLNTFKVPTSVPDAEVPCVMWQQFDRIIGKIQRIQEQRVRKVTPDFLKGVKVPDYFMEHEAFEAVQGIRSIQNQELHVAGRGVLSAFRHETRVAKKAKTTDV